MILQTGMRTDIPAFYSEWFMNRIKEGYVLVRNPYYPEQVTRYEINTNVVDLIAFCTKDPIPMMKYTEKLKAYGQYWFVTITPYGKDLEPNVPDKNIVIKCFRELSGIVGINSMGWRYDPVIVSKKYTVDHHISAFEKIASQLYGCTETCIISFVDLYEKVKRNAPEIREVTPSEQITLAKVFAEIGSRYGIKVKGCHEDPALAEYGIDISGCLNRSVYEKALGISLDMPKRRSQRECSCFFGTDIGAYNSCGHLCRYCYANADTAVVKRNMSRHDPNSPFLIGGSLPNDIIRNAEQHSYIDEQLSLF